MFLFFWSDVVCVYCLFAEQVWSLFWRRPCFVVFFFFFWGTSFFFFSGSFFFSLQIPLFKIWNYQISFRSLFFFVFFHFFFISSISDHNFIPVYWPKFTGKAETKRNRPNLKNRSRFSELYDMTTVCTGPYFFPIERFLKLKKP